ncbi:response regulator [Clostridium estertheticum]|uniref:response regulator n=1 Tax=Clostridium estertheticum TaxID=238834 RepID=UPI001C0B48D7|nr:response regulator transcription factor [Clostridium estertheticum]MBU3072654.1 response regulator transcription factor [Clostridium estertheticum]MBU3162747.1 response regulator transcription factor [Clostridium estertheticum]MBU3184959.1 response regulator transcription factor [Clostridium estertheticum]MCB2340155.1 response regulator transcription factor [Clostridium estertheticum]
MDITNNKILIIDDEDALLILLTTVLRKEGFTNVKSINDSVNSIHLCRIYKPDLILLDIMMPNLDGFSVLKEIRKFCMCPIIFLSAKSEEIDKLLGLGIGGDDYVTKPFSPKEVAFRIKAHLRRIELTKQSFMKEDYIFENKDFKVDLKKGEIEKDGEIYLLRAKELKLLKFLIQNSNIILSKEQIVQEVWEDTFTGYDNTIMVHIRKLREKLEILPSNPKYIITVKGVGYKFIL